MAQDILNIPPLGCLNLHGSLLPKYRGRSPINWVLIKGEKETGVTLHYMTSKPDNGDIVCQKRIEIEEDDTAKTLFDKAAVAASGMLDETLPRIKAGSAPLVIACGAGALKIDYGQRNGGLYTNGDQLARELSLQAGMSLSATVLLSTSKIRTMKSALGNLRKCWWRRFRNIPCAINFRSLPVLLI